MQTPECLLDYLLIIESLVAEIENNLTGFGSETPTRVFDHFLSPQPRQIRTILGKKFRNLYGLRNFPRTETQLHYPLGEAFTIRGRLPCGRTYWVFGMRIALVRAHVKTARFP